jgi:quinol monooxygenase YgiN
MQHPKVVFLVEVPVLPGFLSEVKAIAKAQLVPTLRESGCELFYQASKKEKPDVLVFLEVFSSQADFDLHMQADYTRQFFAGLHGKLAGEPLTTHLEEI